MSHTFHIPVLGLGYSIDTPLKVGRFGISSVVSIVDDELTERMRKYHAELQGLDYVPISIAEPDARARRITAYLNLLHDILERQMDILKSQDFVPGTELTTYFELLPEDSELKKWYQHMLTQSHPLQKKKLQAELKHSMQAGAIDVNIMSKVDKANYSDDHTYLGDDFTDAIAAMRGFVKSKLNASVVISAGLNPRLYAYMEQCKELYAAGGMYTKKVILKVSDFRSAYIQAKMLAKRGIWISEFRIESGLNCGGHAFATDGLLTGPILAEFKEKRTALLDELWNICTVALHEKGMDRMPKPGQRISFQGGIGTAEEHQFLMKHYELDATGWGSPFLLVPEATNVDEETLAALISADEHDFFISNSSPLGVLFNNFRKSTAESQRIARIEKGRPGSPCKKKYLCTNTEFSLQPICTASRAYQHLKIEQLKELELADTEYAARYESITEKVCLCEGLCASAYLKNDILKPRENKAVSICPGPNLAYFSGRYSLSQMIGHIYGREDLLENVERPNLFVNELNLYLDYLKKDISAHIAILNAKKEKHFQKFSESLQQGIAYYRNLIPDLQLKTPTAIAALQQQLSDAEQKIRMLIQTTIPSLSLPA
ncbi:hypothetical protein [Pedobacter duraquae]|uniref:Uncharacterized protein n=1 Tax=Pedobacter duraquae TaxID=425511 RepID=A0A4R6IR14_9SPHI|nr:hypothetical protein [Pedobacter duraquae]TDO24822.1 hypothetical protein CLV32_1115 [Pedobacter duraquae]